MKPIEVEGISTDDISVIIQGAFDQKTTLESIRLLRKVLPGAKLILSTWENSKLPDSIELNVDEIVLSSDPGAVLSDETNRIFYNYNRQLISTKSGLAKAKTKFSLKIRTDMLIKDVNFLSHFFSFPKREKKFSVFKERLIVSSMFTRHRFIDEKREYNKPILHISDWGFFGLTEDMNLYFNNAELVAEPHFSTYFKNQCDDTEVVRCYSTMTCRFPPEQQLAISSFSKFFPILNSLKDYAEKRDDLVKLSDNIILHNFIILDPHSWPLIVNKPDYLQRSKDISKFSIFEFKTLYREHIFRKEYAKYTRNQKREWDRVLIRHNLRFKIIISFIVSKFNCFEESRLFYYHGKKTLYFLWLILKEASYGNFQKLYGNKNE